MDRQQIVFVIAALIATPVWADSADSAREARCIADSARYNGIPATLLRAIRLQEGGRAGAWRINANASVDYGIMQINSRWLPVLAPQGYTAIALTYDVCASIAAGAWILAHALADAGAWNRTEQDGRVYWRAVGDYHSYTPSLNRTYAEQVWKRYRQQQQLSTGGKP